jgi:CRP-like cAMP-binding protein
MNLFRQFIEKYTSLSDQEWSEIESCLVRKEVKKEQLILEEGKVCKHLYFLKSGLLRFFIQKDGQEITKYFTDIPYCFTSQKSFSTQQPAKESIETLEDSVIWQISFEDTYRLLKITNWSNFIRELIQEVQSLTEEILEELQTETAEIRYRKMLESNDNLLQRVPLKHLASYLGIAPQSLSRIRKNIVPSKRS